MATILVVVLVWAALIVFVVWGWARFRRGLESGGPRAGDRS